MILVEGERTQAVEHTRADENRRESPSTVQQLLFWTLAALVLLICVLADRSVLLDNESYVGYFYLTTTSWIADFFSAPIPELLATSFSEEIVWRLWCYLLSGLLGIEPAFAVTVTVILLNLLLVLGFQRCSRPVVALAFWIVSPLGLAVVGTSQIRQGFALSVAVFCWFVVKRPLVGLVLASMIHTTMCPVLAFYVVAVVAGKSKERHAIVTMLCAFVVAYFGSELFTAYGGRRAATYSADYGVSSLNFLLNTVIYAAVPVCLLVFSAKQLEQHPETLQLVRAYVGVIAFVLFSYFLFPLGTSRVAYYTTLLWGVVYASAPVRAHWFQYGGLATAVMVAYQAYRGISVGSYDEIIYMIVS